MPVPTLWYCNYCSYGPMKIAISEHCCMCHRQRDAYASYEVPDTHSHAAPPPPTASWNDLTLESSLQTIEEPRRSFSIASACEQEVSLDNLSHHERTYAINPTFTTCRTLCGPAPRHTKWYCCSCNDGPKNIKLQPRCIICHHVKCGDCKDTS